MLTMSWLYCHEQSMRTGMSSVKSILQMTEFSALFAYSAGLGMRGLESNPLRGHYLCHLTLAIFQANSPS